MLKNESYHFSDCSFLLFVFVVLNVCLMLILFKLLFRKESEFILVDLFLCSREQMEQAFQKLPYLVAA